MYIDVLGSWDTGGRRLTINSGFSYYPSTPDFAFRGVSARLWHVPHVWHERKMCALSGVRCRVCAVQQCQIWSRPGSRGGNIEASPFGKAPYNTLERRPQQRPSPRRPVVSRPP